MRISGKTIQTGIRIAYKCSAKVPSKNQRTKVRLDKTVFMAFVVAAMLSACGGDGSENVAPIANAGPDQSVVAGSTVVTLDGSRSTDANGDPIRFTWAMPNKPQGSNAVLSDSSSPKPTFVADLPGSYVATLRVNDGQVDSAASVVTVTAAVANAAPVANAGNAQNVIAGATVTLDGSASSDANNDALTYAWVLSTRPNGSAAALTSATVAKPTFTADVAGTYIATLKVNDGQIDSAASTVTITAAVANAAPIANAGAAQSVIAGSAVTLNGSGSTDANGDTLSYSWTLSTKPTGSAAALTGATTAAPAFTADVPGTYVATLIVNDGKVNSAPSTVAITATTVVGFDSATPLPPNMPSYGFEANAIASLGDRVTLKPGSPRTLHTITVAMSSWACQTGGWNTKDCVSAANATFDHPITLKVYDSMGNLIATRTQTFSIPYRPSADPTCVMTDAGKWKAANGTCYNGFAAAIVFDLRSLSVKLPDDVLTFEVSYNTRDYGSTPLGVTGPYDSLNVGVYDSSLTAPSIGSDAEPGVLRVNGTPSADGYGIMAQVMVVAP